MDFLKNDRCTEEFHTNGYTVLPLLSSTEIELIICLFEKMRKDAGLSSEFYTSIWSDNINHRRQVDEELKSILFPILQKHIADIQPVFANFMVKVAGENSLLNPHQDWSFVEEPLYDSMTVWIPLIDVNHLNGNLQVVPSSHLNLLNYIRPRFGHFPFDQHEASKKMVDIPMKAGEALILNSRLIHGSPPNTGSKIRVAASLVIAPSKAPLKHWVINDNVIKELFVTPSFFWEYSCFDKLLELIPNIGL